MTQFLDEGIVFPCAALPAGEALALEPAYYKLARRMSGWTNGAQILKSHLVCPWVCELVHNPALLDVIERLIGPDILCWSATFFAKEAGSDGYVGWHQDIHYWGLDPAEEVVTAWLGLTDASEDNGCMFFVPGSHRGGDRPHQRLPDTSNMLLGSQEVSLCESEQAQRRAVVLQPGQFSVHHARLLHGSYGNLSQRPRIGLSINYMSTRVQQQTNGGVDSAMLVRGVDSYGNFVQEPRPQGDFDAAGIDAYKAALLTPSGIGGADDSIYDMRPNLDHIK
jgi:non-heme Fe2+,alpha-ketoglutarate-dependent halogenase